MLRICLFGSLSVAQDGAGPAIAIAGRGGSLLAYLALGRGRHFSRAELMDALWAEQPGGASAGCFNTALWRLRRTLERAPLEHGDLICCDRRGGLGLNPAAPVWLDVEEFERLVAAGLSVPLERLDAQAVEGLRAAVRLYRADILADVSEVWALRERERQRRSYLNALGRLMQVARLREEPAEAITHAQAILDCDPLREDVHRELMRLFVLNGQRAQVLRQYEHCRDLLRRELAIPPMPETTALHREISDAALARSPMAASKSLPTLTQAFDAPPCVDDGSLAPYLHRARQGLARVDVELMRGLQALGA